MKIWIDGDACPNAVKNVLFKAADRRQVETVLVANHYVRTMNSPWISSIQVPGGFDVADHTIVEKLESGDLVITADIPLANEVIDKGAHALNPRGTLYDRENIKNHLARRDMMEELRKALQEGNMEEAMKRAEEMMAAMNEMMAGGVEEFSMDEA